MAGAARATRGPVPALLAGLAVGAAQAQTTNEIWPELSLYVALRPEARLYLDASRARSKEAPATAQELTAALDLTLPPLLRPGLTAADWRGDRYLWTRLGYTYVSKVADGSSIFAENRIQAAVYAQAPLPQEVWLETRARVDFRWIDDVYSARYRFRLDFSREFPAFNHWVKPYANVEWFYDTRFQAWSRTQYQAGVEARLGEHFRVEVYLARQNDREPDDTAVNALGLVAKWYY